MSAAPAGSLTSWSDAADHLAERYRQVFLLGEGLKTAEALGDSSDMVETRPHRACTGLFVRLGAATLRTASRDRRAVAAVMARIN